MVVTKQSIIGDVVMADDNVAPLLMSMGLHCIGCAMSTGESIEEAAMDLDADDLVNELNMYFKANPVPRVAEAEF